MNKAATTFIKTNPLPGTRALECERRGLEELRRHQSRHGLHTPEVLKSEPHQLTLERIAGISPSTQDWQRLGEGLAKLHQVTSDQFGFSEDNFIGLNPQPNPSSKNWGEFFFTHRLLFQTSLIQEHKLKSQLLNDLEAHKQKLIDFLNAHNPKPSLLHGDLWSGNIMFDASGPWLIDPAVYYGDKECDLAMTKMFGGFSSEFYSAYYSLSPLPDHHEKRFIIYNLYHYLNHYNLFGGGYLSSVKAGFRVITSL